MKELGRRGDGGVVWVAALTDRVSYTIISVSPPIKCFRWLLARQALACHHQPKINTDRATKLPFLFVGCAADRGRVFADLLNPLWPLPYVVVARSIDTQHKHTHTQRTLGILGDDRIAFRANAGKTEQTRSNSLLRAPAPVRFQSARCPRKTVSYSSCGDT